MCQRLLSARRSMPLGANRAEAGGDRAAVERREDVT